MKPEDAVVLRAFARIRSIAPGALLVLAPRQRERFAEVETLAADEGFTVAKRSELPIDSEPRTDVVVLDTFGELAQVYQIATLVFVGGSLADYGGHNILEPAIFGKPIVVGPHMHNFREITETFLASRAPVQLQKLVAMYPYRVAYDVVDAMTVLCEYESELRAMQELWPAVKFHALREHSGLVFQSRLEAA